MLNGGNTETEFSNFESHIYYVLITVLLIKYKIINEGINYSWL